MQQPKTYCYTFIRSDLPLEQQIVQAAHATLEAGLRAGQAGINPKETSSLILLSVPNEDKLLTAHEKISQAGIDCALFYEPDSDLGYEPGYTAFATLPITSENRHHFKRYKLFKA